MVRLPDTWDEVPELDDVDKEDEEGELLALFNDVTIYDIDDLEGFEQPQDPHNIDETIFVIRKDGRYYLCESQGENRVKFAAEITNVPFVQQYDRLSKLAKVYENIISMGGQDQDSV